MTSANMAVVCASPIPGSRSRAIADHVGRVLAERGFSVESLDVLDLPPADLLWARAESPAIRAATRVFERADGIVLITPVYNAAYTGVLKAVLDMLPRYTLSGKVILPMALGGSLAHVLAIDYALRPVLASMGARHVVGGLFLLDSWLPRTDGGSVLFDHEEVQGRLATGLEQLSSELDLRAAVPERVRAS